jgi:hypothetical protein
MGAGVGGNAMMILVGIGSSFSKQVSASRFQFSDRSFDKRHGQVDTTTVDATTIHQPALPKSNHAARNTGIN